MASALDHLEAMLADSYRRELDHEENIWRSLPFFAATLTLEVSALSQVLGHLNEVAAAVRGVALGLLAAAWLCSLTAVGFTLAMISRVSFRYIEPERELMKYAPPPLGNGASIALADPLDGLKLSLVSQFWIATEHNRRINQRRNQWRVAAGVFTLFAILATVLLAGVVFWHHITVMLDGGAHATS